LREKRYQVLGAIVAVIASVAVAGCGGDEDPVRLDSIVDRGQADRARLANSSFEEPTLTPWDITGERFARFALTRRLSWEGQRSARVDGRGRRVRGSVVLGQVARSAVPTERGARYRLLLRARTRDLNRRVQVALKLIYDNGDFEFFPGRAVSGSPGLPTSGTGIPPGTWRRWITVQADAVAARDVRDIQVFALDSGPGRLRGTVWIDSVELTGPDVQGR
jgi:hypothetical protein